MDRKQLAGMIDHTLLKAFATETDIKQLCKEAVDIGAAAVCVNPVHVQLSRRELEGSGVKVCTVIGFPLGANTSRIKAAETEEAVANGADEIDMVINIGALKGGDREVVYNDIFSVVQAAKGVIVKVIIEACYLTDEEKKWACELAAIAGADYVKTSTGFGIGGASRHDVELMKQTLPPNVHVKAAGGIRSWSDAVTLLEAGADRLGVSASLSILSKIDE